MTCLPSGRAGGYVSCLSYLVYRWWCMMRDEEITRAIIGSTYRVHNTPCLPAGRLGFGSLESVYERSLVIELARHRLKAEALI